MQREKTMGEKLKGKVAVVTGAGQGAGRGAALAMAAEGAAVILFGRTIGKIEAVSAEIAARGGVAVPFAGDVTVQSDRAACIDLALDRFGRLDILVNAAQSPEMRTARLLDVSLELLDELWSSGAVATFALMRLAYPHMLAAGGGSIVNFSTGAERGPQYYGAYAAVKSAIRTLSRAAAVEWGPKNIRVNVVVPMVHSPSNDADPTDHQLIVAQVPLRRIGDPEQDIGRPIAFIASDEAAYITGMAFALDGGLTYLN